MNGLDCQALYLLTDQRWVIVQGCHQMKSVRGETRVAENSFTQATYPYHGYVPLSVEAQNLIQFVQQVPDTVTPALLAKAPKVAQVFPYLRWSYVKLLPQLLGVGDLYTFSQQKFENADVLGQSSNDYLGPCVSAVVLGQPVIRHSGLCLLYAQLSLDALRVGRV